MIYVRHPDGSLYAAWQEFSPNCLAVVLGAMGDQRAATLFDGHPSDGAKVICRIDLDGLPDTPPKAPATPQEPAGDQLPAAGSVWSAHIEVELTDPGALYDVARDKFEENNPGEDPEEFFGTREAPKVDACLIELIDPGAGGFLDAGFQVLNSGARRH